ncbi:DNA-repair protein complementing XP-A cells [Nematocida ausubeli]|nr:DNA-repair protein complementing XP-A cells [Nematocida ausubeli]
MKNRTEFINKTIETHNIYTQSTKIKENMQYDEYVCDECHGNGVDQSIRTAFKVNYCGRCKLKLELVSQTTAINDYLLNKEDIRHLQHLKALNPRNPDWKPMILYRKTDIERISLRKYPNIEEERKQRQEKLAERKKKALKKKLACLRRTTRAKVKEDPIHVHAFNDNGACECGMKIEFEEI